MNLKISSVLRRKATKVAIIYPLLAWIILRTLFLAQAGLDMPSDFSKATALFLLLGYPLIILVAWSSEYKEIDQLKRLFDAEDRLTKELSFSAFLQASIRFVAERKRLLMIKAEARGNSLYRLGTALTIVSVLAPVFTIWVYVQVDPLPQDFVSRLSILIRENGSLPEGLLVDVSKDWRILISGISFGLLFLTAAGALFVQYQRQMNIVFRMGQDVDYYDRVLSATEIRSRAQAETIDDRSREMAERVVDSILSHGREHSNESSSAEVGTDNSTSEQLSELMKSITSLKK